MSNVPFSIFPFVRRELNELQATVQPEAVHPDHLMRRCRSIQVSSISELKENLPRSTWPRWINFANANLNATPYWISATPGSQKATYPVSVVTQWQQGEFGVQHNTFRVTVVLSPRTITEELRIETEFSEELYRTRFRYIADVIESGLVYALLGERSVPAAGPLPQSFATAIAQNITILTSLEAGSENFYFMLNPYVYALMYRQAPPRLGITGATVLQSMPPKLKLIPVTSRNSINFAPDNRIVGYTDYLTKATTRYFLETFRIEKNKRSLTDQNLYNVVFERWVSYDLPVLTDDGAGEAYTWASSSVITVAPLATQNNDEINGPAELNTLNFAHLNTSY